ncbi:uncharacterized protein LOC120337212 isoform X2 [Styela clava]
MRATIYYYIKRRKWKFIYVVIGILFVMFTFHMLLKNSVDPLSEYSKHSRESQKTCTTLFVVVHFRIPTRYLHTSPLHVIQQIKEKLESYTNTSKGHMFVDNKIADNGLPESMQECAYYIRGANGSRGKCGYVWGFDSENHEIRYDTCKQKNLKTSWKYCKLSLDKITEMTTESAGPYNKFCSPNLAASWPLQDIHKCALTDESRNLHTWVEYARSLDENLMNNEISKYIGFPIRSWQVLGLVIEYDMYLLGTGFKVLRTIPVYEPEEANIIEATSLHKKKDSGYSKIGTKFFSTEYISKNTATFPTLLNSASVPESAAMDQMQSTTKSETTMVSSMQSESLLKYATANAPYTTLSSIIKPSNLATPTSQSSKYSSTILSSITSPISFAATIFDSQHDHYMITTEHPTPSMSDEKRYYETLRKIYPEMFSTSTPAKKLNRPTKEATKAVTLDDNSIYFPLYGNSVSSGEADLEGSGGVPFSLEHTSEPTTTLSAELVKDLQALKELVFKIYGVVLKDLPISFGKLMTEIHDANYAQEDSKKVIGQIEHEDVKRSTITPVTNSVSEIDTKIIAIANDDTFDGVIDTHFSVTTSFNDVTASFRSVSSATTSNSLNSDALTLRTQQPLSVMDTSETTNFVQSNNDNKQSIDQYEDIEQNYHDMLSTYKFVHTVQQSASTISVRSTTSLDVEDTSDTEFQNTGTTSFSGNYSSKISTEHNHVLGNPTVILRPLVTRNSGINNPISEPTTIKFQNDLSIGEQVGSGFLTNTPSSQYDHTSSNSTTLPNPTEFSNISNGNNQESLLEISTKWNEEMAVNLSSNHVTTLVPLSVAVDVNEDESGSTKFSSASQNRSISNDSIILPQTTQDLLSRTSISTTKPNTTSWTDQVMHTDPKGTTPLYLIDVTVAPEVVVQQSHNIEKINASKLIEQYDYTQQLNDTGGSSYEPALRQDNHSSAEIVEDITSTNKIIPLVSISKPLFTNFTTGNEDAASGLEQDTTSFTQSTNLSMLTTVTIADDITQFNNSDTTYAWPSSSSAISPFSIQSDNTIVQYFDNEITEEESTDSRLHYDLMSSRPILNYIRGTVATETTLDSKLNKLPTATASVEKMARTDTTSNDFINMDESINVMSTATDTSLTLDIPKYSKAYVTSVSSVFTPVPNGVPKKHESSENPDTETYVSITEKESTDSRLHYDLMSSRPTLNYIPETVSTKTTLDSKLNKLSTATTSVEKMVRTDIPKYSEVYITSVSSVFTPVPNGAPKKHESSENLDPETYVSSAISGKWFEYKLPVLWSEVLKRNNDLQIIVNLTMIEKVHSSDPGLISEAWLVSSCPTFGTVCGLPVARNRTKINQISTFILTFDDKIITLAPIMLHVSVYPMSSITQTNYEINTHMDVKNNINDVIQIYSPILFAQKLVSYLQKRDHSTVLLDINLLEYEVSPQPRKKRSISHSIEAVWSMYNTSLDKFNSTFQSSIFDWSRGQVAQEFFSEMLPEFIVTHLSITPRNPTPDRLKSVKRRKQSSVAYVLLPIFISVFILFSCVAYFALRKKRLMYFIPDIFVNKTFGPSRKPIYLDGEIEMDYFHPRKARIIVEDCVSEKGGISCQSSVSFPKFPTSNQRYLASPMPNMNNTNAFDEVAVFEMSDESICNGSGCDAKSVDGFYSFTNASFHIHNK